MKIVQVITALNLGGAQTLLENLAYGLAEEGHDVSVISLESDHTATAKRLETKGIPVIYLGKRPHYDPRITGKLARTLKQLKPDIVHAHNIRKLYVLGAARKAGCRNLVYTVHNMAGKEQGFVGGLFSWFVFRAGLMVPVGLSPIVTESIEERYHLRYVPTIYNGTDLSCFHKKTDYRLHGHPTILNVARLDPMKNHKRLFEAFGMVIREFPEAELVLVGEGSLTEELKTIARTSGIADKVHFEGLRDNIPDYLDRADIFCLSSDYEGLPMTLIEAMASALPILSTEVGGIPDMLKDEKTALLTAPDASALAEAMIRLLSDERLRRRLGEGALHASERFSHRHMAGRYLKLYQSVLNTRKKG